MNANKLSILVALTLGLGGSLLVPAQAQAGEGEKAEHRRLSEEMNRLAGRGAWQGVNDRFEELLALEKKGEVLTYEEWFLGAYSKPYGSQPESQAPRKRPFHCSSMHVGCQ